MRPNRLQRALRVIDPERDGLNPFAGHVEAVQCDSRDGEDGRFEGAERFHKMAPRAGAIKRFVAI
jgi:hypothetical protein